MGVKRTCIRNAIFRLIERGGPIPLGERGEQRWAIPSAIILVEHECHRDEGGWRALSPPPATGSSTPSATRRARSPARPAARKCVSEWAVILAAMGVNPSGREPQRTRQ
jgi:hypothetical protein